MPQLGFLQFLTASGGNWVIYLLIVFSVIAVAVIIERIVVVTRQCRYQDAALTVITFPSNPTCATWPERRSPRRIAAESGVAT